MARKKKSVVREEPAGIDPTYEQVAERAYDLYLARGETHGHDIDDWLAVKPGEMAMPPNVSLVPVG